MMKHMLMMIIGCALPLLVIFLLPAFGVNGDWVILLAILGMFACHLMHFGMHDHGKKEHHEHQHRSENE